MDKDLKLKFLAEKIDWRIKSMGIRRQEFANYLNVSPSLITNYLSGTHNFTVKTLIQIEDALGISLLDLNKRMTFHSERKCLPCRYTLPG